MSSYRTTVSMSPSLHEKVKARMAEKDFATFSGYVQALIRADVGASKDSSPSEHPIKPEFFGAKKKLIEARAKEKA